MLIVGAALKGYAIEATDGKLGTVSDFLFDDRTWKIRWMVVDTGSWLTGRKILVHPSAIGDPDIHRRELPVRLTKAQVEASPDIMSDEPVSEHMQHNLYGYYGWDSMWGGGSYFGSDPIMGTPYGMAPGYGGAGVLDAPALDVSDDHDPHLRSIGAVTGYHIQATDGAIGHLENFLVDDATWGIRYLIVDTRNWWPGQHVLLSPYAVRKISWPDSEVEVDVSRERVKGSPPWNPAELIERSYQTRLHGYYDWPGYGW